MPTRSTDLVSGLYAIGAIHVNVKGVCTNTVPVCAYRGAGRPEAAYLLERIVDAAARELGMSPDAIRRVNFVPPSAMPYTSATKLVLDSGEFEEVMDRCMAAAEWSSFPARRARSERDGKLRGIGMATYTERCGGGFPETASIEFKDDRVELVMGNQEYGTGLVTSYKQLVSDQLGIDADRIDVIMGDTDRTPAGTDRRLARDCRSAARRSRGGPRRHRQGQPARRVIFWKSSAQDIAFADGAFSVPGTDLHIDSDGGRQGGARSGASCRRAWSPASTPRTTACRRRRPFRTAATSSRSRSIPTPARVAIERYTIVDDFGRTINPLLLEGQVHGGIVQGIGQALLEHAVYDPKTAANCWQARSWTTPCRARATFRPSPSPRTMCPRRPIRSASKAPARRARSARRQR